MILPGASRKRKVRGENTRYPTNDQSLDKSEGGFTQMEKWECTVCGYIYDPYEEGGIAFEDLPADWVCPLCGVGKEDFELLED